MTFIVGENCVLCKHTDCVEVCPVDCFYEGPNVLVIHPDVCIDCAACVPVCPVSAIYPEDELPAEQEDFIGINRTFSARWPQIRTRKAPLPEADRWNGVPGKRKFLDDSIAVASVASEKSEQ